MISLFFHCHCSFSSLDYNLWLSIGVKFGLSISYYVFCIQNMEALCHKSSFIPILLLHLIHLLETDFVVQCASLEWSFCSACFAFSCQEIIGWSSKSSLFTHESWGIVRMLEINKSVCEIRLCTKSCCFL